MSFKCGLCFEPQKPGVRPIRVTRKSRERIYRDEDRREQYVGREIVSEIDLCQPCYDEVLP